MYFLERASECWLVKEGLSSVELAPDSRFLVEKGDYFAVLPVGTHRSTRGQALLTAGSYIIHHGQCELLRNNRYQLNEIDSHVASGNIISVCLSPPNWVRGHTDKCYGLFHLFI
jgi:hypothetical protein